MTEAWKSAPGELELVREFVNTLEIDAEKRSEELPTPAELTAWLREHALLAAETELDQDDLRRALELREALRQILLAHNDVPVGRAPFEAFDRIVADAHCSVRMDSEGSARLEPCDDSGLDAAIGRFAAIVYAAEVEGTWSRLKACAAEDCQWAFYDASRNRSGTWCDMSSCGNRAKVRAHRQRTRERGGA